ncbi:MAG: hypothetical protein U9P42_00285, partial [Candidatus Fermentibacteria bacterium]|nr:hypothetical protein [Candidatus Fermentibacteria bacterium]
QEKHFYVTMVTIRLDVKSFLFLYSMPFPSPAFSPKKLPSLQSPRSVSSLSSQVKRFSHPACPYTVAVILLTGIASGSIFAFMQ